MIKKTRRKRTRNILTLAISIIMITYYVIGISQNQFLPTGKKNLDKKNITPDSSSTGVVIKRFNQNGELHYTMSTNQADFFTATSATTLPTAVTSTPKNTAKKNNHSHPSSDTKISANLVEEDYLRMLDPKITAYENGKPSTSIAANLAYLSNNGDTAELIGNVLVNDMATTTQLQSQSLTLNTDLQQILTQSPIMIHTPTSTTHATGLQGNLIDHRWQLLSEVKSIVQP